MKILAFSFALLAASAAHATLGPMDGFGGGLGWGGDHPTMPSILLESHPDKNSVKEFKRSNLEKIQGELKKLSADMAVLDSKIHPLRVDRRALLRQLEDPNSDQKDKRTAKEALDKINAELKKMAGEMTKLTTDYNKRCFDQYGGPNSAFYDVDESEKQEFNKLGFSCASGEKLVADQAPREYIACGTPLGKTAGSNAIVPMGGPGEWGGGTMGMGSFGMKAGAASDCVANMMKNMPVPLGRLACLNEKKRIVASAVIQKSRYGKYLTNNSRFKFDDEQRIKGWKTTLDFGGLSEVTIKGDKIERRTYNGDQELSKCETPAYFNYEKYYSEMPQPWPGMGTKPAESSNLVK